MAEKKVALESNYDVILIGAGIGGLVCSNYLAKSGHKVLLLEKHFIPGGYLTGFYRKGFYFDAGDQSFGGLAVVEPSLEELGIRDKVEFHHADWRLVCPDVDIWIKDLDEVAGAFIAGFPDDREGILTLLDEIKKGIDRMKSGEMILEDLQKISKHAWLEKYLTNQNLINLLKKNGYANWPARTEVRYWFTMTNDYSHIRGGTQHLSDVLAQNILDHGGTIAYKTQAEKIMVEDGNARGVVTQDGTEIRSKFVVTCCDYKQTFEKLVDQRFLDPAWLKKLNESIESETFVAVYLGTDIPHDEMKELMKAYHLTVYDNYEFSLATAVDDPDLHKKTFYEATSPSMDNLDLAPQGKSSLILQAISSYEWMDTWRTGPGGKRTKAYQDLKNTVADQLIKVFERVIPDLSERIELMDVGTPLTHEDYTFNSRGASAGWSWNMDDVPFHDSQDLVIETPIRDLYAASHWTGPRESGVVIAWDSAVRVARTLLEVL
jgi:prolycopene isomerase